MSRSSSLVAVSPLLFAALVAAQPRFVNGVHEDPKLGFKIKVPEKWTSVPVDIDEKWIVAKFLCHRDYAGKTAYTLFKPEMRIIHFTPEKAKFQEKAESHGDTTYITKTLTFRNYKDWFKEYMKGGRGFHHESEKTQMLGEVPVTKIETITDQGADGALRFACWIYERKSDGATFAVEFSQLDDYWKNLVDDFDKTFKTFRFIEVGPATAGAVDDGELENPPWTRDLDKWRELPKTERWKVRQSIEVKRRDKMLANVAEGWFTQESKSKRFLAISHADKKYTTLVLDKADATWDWLDKRFGGLSDDYVMSATVRICKDYDEAASYGAKSASGDSYSFDDREIVDFKDRDAGSSGGGQRLLQRGLLAQYVIDKDPRATYAPGWLVSALSGYLSTGEVEGKKLVFAKGDTWERIYVKEAEREGALRTFNELITSLSDDWPREAQPFYRLLAQYYSLIRFLESKDCPKILDGFIPRYFAAVVKAGEQWKKTNPGTTQAKTEQEEEAKAKGRSQMRKEREKFIVDSVAKEVANFSQKEWQQIEGLWKRWLTK